MRGYKNVPRKVLISRFINFFFRIYRMVCLYDWHLNLFFSFGFCEKQAKDKHEPIGQFGSGFKSGSMRIGKDVLVFTRSGKSASVGFLSQTYLNNTNAKSVLVPILCYSLPGHIF